MTVHVPVFRFTSTFELGQESRLCLHEEDERVEDVVVCKGKHVTGVVDADAADELFAPEVRQLFDVVSARQL